MPFCGTPDFFRYLIGRFVASLGQQMLVMAIDWELYHRTHSALSLAFVGLSLMVPMILLTIPAGHFADLFNRKKIILAATLVLAVASVGLALTSYFTAPVYWIYLCLFVLGAARTFLWPASAAFVPSLVPRNQFARAVTFNSGAFQFSCVVGPAACGLVISLAHQTAWAVYALNALASIICFALVVPIKHQHKTRPAEPVSAKSLIEGFRFVYQSKIILGIITLDLFAVLLGGTVTHPAHLRRRHFPRRPLRPGLAAQRHVHRRRDLHVDHRASPDAAKGRARHAFVGRDFRRGDDSYSASPMKIVSAAGSRCRMRFGSGFRSGCWRWRARWTT